MDFDPAIARCLVISDATQKEMLRVARIALAGPSQPPCPHVVDGRQSPSVPMTSGHPGDGSGSQVWFATSRRHVDVCLPAGTTWSGSPRVLARMRAARPLSSAAVVARRSLRLDDAHRDRTLVAHRGFSSLPWSPTHSALPASMSEALAWTMSLGPVDGIGDLLPSSVGIPTFRTLCPLPAIASFPTDSTAGRRARLVLVGPDERRLPAPRLSVDRRHGLLRPTGHGARRNGLRTRMFLKRTAG